MRYLLFLALLFSACSEKFANTDQTYEVEFVANWSAETHPTDFPSNAHFSPVFALAHKSNLDLLREGLLASKGVQQMAETGATDALKNEFDELKKDKSAFSFSKGTSIESPGKNIQKITVQSGFHKVTLFAMIAPSPDWYIAGSTELFDTKDNLWFDEVSLIATAYDAGTDAGTTFTSADSASIPQQAIQKITQGVLSEGDSIVKPLGKFIFRRIK